MLIDICLFNFLQCHCALSFSFTLRLLSPFAVRRCRTKPRNCIWQNVEITARKTFINSAVYQCSDTVLLNYCYYY